MRYIWGRVLIDRSLTQQGFQLNPPLQYVYLSVMRTAILIKISYEFYLVQANQVVNNCLTNGVRRVRLYASAALRIASAWVG